MYKILRSDVVWEQFGKEIYLTMSSKTDSSFKNASFENSERTIDSRSIDHKHERNTPLFFMGLESSTIPWDPNTQKREETSRQKITTLQKENTSLKRRESCRLKYWYVFFKHRHCSIQSRYRCKRNRRAMRYGVQVDTVTRTTRRIRTCRRWLRIRRWTHYRIRFTSLTSWRKEERTQKFRGKRLQPALTSKNWR